MGEILKKGQKIKSGSLICEIEDFLGSGSQGEVYRVRLNGKQMALKWYFSHTGTPQQKEGLEKLINIGSPSERFLWPVGILTDQAVKGFGYVMPLRPPGYKSLFDLMKRRIEPTFKSLATAGFQLSDSFLMLHAKGMCYRDISFGNVFLHPGEGEVLICDNDNVAVDSKDFTIGILGTPRFMAPEVVRGESNPSTQTDLFSLAVLLFYMFFMHHPLEGKRDAEIKCFDLPAMNKLYGYEPLFIFDPNNDENQPIPGFHDNAIVFWPLYPLFLKKMFLKAFTAGIKDPSNGRIRESEWRAAMISLRDSIIYCKCGAENFYDPEEMKAGAGKSVACWNCMSDLKYPLRICIENSVVMLNYDSKLYPHHVDNDKLYDFSLPVAEVNQHPQKPGVWGLKNLGTEKWVFNTPDNQVADVEPDQSIRLTVGSKINFGKKTGEVRI
jgi:eukaryotic-like serine/threonine-protein kinase